MKEASVVSKNLQAMRMKNQRTIAGMKNIYWNLKKMYITTIPIGHQNKSEKQGDLFFTKIFLSEYLIF